MATEKVAAEKGIRYIISASGLSKDTISARLNKSRKYVSTLVSKNSIPIFTTFCKIAYVCGYTVVLERGKERVEIIPPDVPLG